MFRSYSRILSAFRIHNKLQLHTCRPRINEGKECTKRWTFLRNFSSENKPVDKSIKINTESTDAQQDSQTTANTDTWIRSVNERFSEYRDEDANIILDQLEQELDESADVEVITPSDDPFYGFDLQRGVAGVFDVHSLVDVLRGENARDICVIQIPKEMKYADNLVIASGFSAKHILAMATFIKRLYKKKRSSKDPFVVIDGENSKNWLAMDMGNIVLHLFLPEQRKQYDIEMLWSVGSQYDEKSQKKEDLLDKFEEHLEFLKTVKPLT